MLCRPANVTALEVHQISVGPPLEALDASTGPYLMHARRVNYDRKDLPQPCAGAGDRCTLVGGGGSHEAVLNCTGGDGGDSIGITSTFVRAGRA